MMRRCPAPALGLALLLGLAALAACEGPLPEVGLESGDPTAAGLPELWRPLDESLLPQRRVPPVEPRPLEHAPDSNRVVILGLDGADWRMLEPLIRAGLLPNLEMLLAGGAAGVLKTDFAYSPTS